MEQEEGVYHGEKGELRFSARCASLKLTMQLILVDAKPSVRKQILRELQIMNDCNSPYIVGYYGCFLVEVHVGVVMEAMDAG